MQKLTPPPELCAISQCDKSLNFFPQTAWPIGLPAVAVNSVVLAGFDQELAFNHSIEWQDEEKIATLFRSLYFELSFIEISRLILKAKKHKHFPLSAVLKKFSYHSSEMLFKMSEIALELPTGFQSWCHSKKVAPQDLAPLTAAQSLDLKPIFLKILQAECSKSEGVQALELCIDLMLMGKQIDLSEETSAEQWLKELKQQRFPHAAKQDQELEKKLSELPWPGTGQVRWTRQGDRSGIELKIFVSHPTDLKKHLQSLNRVQDILEKDAEWNKTQH